jgi:hypothetical protein
MVLQIATDRALRTPDALADLVAAIVDADPNTDQETHWLEWKGPLAIDRAEGQFAIAKAILGFANREPSHASAVCEGTAYMVVGASPRATPGVVAIDHADLAHGIRKYANGPQWSAHNVNHQGVTVLVIVVDAPRSGDPIHVLAKQYANFNEGTVFHRGAAQTEPAGTREITMLSKRLVQGAQQPDLDLELDLELTEMLRQRLDDPEWYEEHRTYLESRRKPKRPPLTAPPSHAPGVTSRFATSPLLQPGSLAFTGLAHAYATKADTAEFERRLAEYNDDLADRLYENIVRSTIRSRFNKVKFIAANHTHDPIEDVQLTVVMPFDVIVYAGSPETRHLRALPAWPTPIDNVIGKNQQAAFLANDMQHGDVLSRWDGSVDYRDHNHTIEITFDVGDLRPGQRYETPPITLFTEPDGPTALPVMITARAMNRRRFKTKEIEMPITGQTVGIGHWFATTLATSD